VRRLVYAHRRHGSEGRGPTRAPCQQRGPDWVRAPVRDRSEGGRELRSRANLFQVGRGLPQMDRNGRSPDSGGRQRACSDCTVSRWTDLRGIAMSAEPRVRVEETVWRRDAVTMLSTGVVGNRRPVPWNFGVECATQTLCLRAVRPNGAAHVGLAQDRRSTRECAGCTGASSGVA